jgi:hypothetical protein
LGDGNSVLPRCTPCPRGAEFELSVFNVGFIQDLPSINTAFGASYREQGDAFFRI